MMPTSLYGVNPSISAGVSRLPEGVVKSNPINKNRDVNRASHRIASAAQQSDKHGYHVGHITRRVQGGVELRSACEMVKSKPESRRIHSWSCNASKRVRKEPCFGSRYLPYSYAAYRVWVCRGVRGGGLHMSEVHRRNSKVADV